MSSSLENKKLRAYGYANSKARQVNNRHFKNHEKNELHITYFKCNKPGDVSSEGTTKNKTEQEY